MRKILALLLSALMLAGLLASCSGGSSDSSANESSASEESTASSESAESESKEDNSASESETESEVEESGASTDRGTPDEDGVYPFGIPCVDEPITINVEKEREGSDLSKDFNEEHWALKTNGEETGISVEWNILATGTSAEKVPIELAGGDLPDVYWNLVNQAQILQFEDSFYPIEGLFDTYAKNIHEDMTHVEGWEKMAYAPSGHVYSGFGSFQQSTDDSMNGIQIINTKWLENVGLSMPTDWDSYYEVLTAFKTKDANGNGDTNDEIPYGWADDMWAAQLLDNEIGRFGLAVNSKNSTTNKAYQFFEVVDGKVRPVSNTEDYRKYLDVMHQMMDEGLLDPEGFTDGWDEMANKVRNDKVGTYFAWTALEYLDSAAAANWETMERFGYTGYDKFYQPGTLGGNIASAVIWVVTKNAEAPNACVRYWDHLAEDPILTHGMALGEKGTLWDEYEDGSGYYYIIPESEEGMTYENMKYTWGFMGRCPMLTTEECFQNDEEYGGAESVLRTNMVKVVEQYAQSEDDRIKQSYVPDDKMTELSLFESDLANLINTFHGSAIVSGYSDSDWDSYVKQLDQYGYQDLLDWYQHKYDADWE